MAADAKAIVHEWFERVWNRGEASAIDELAARDVQIHGLKGAAGTEVSGLQEFHQLHVAFRQAFPDIRVAVDDCVTEGEKAAFRCTVTGKHSGSALGFDATGNVVEFAGMGFVIVRDGKIVEAWNTFDFLGMNEQLGRTLS